jgi:hypothetical protein
VSANAAPDPQAWPKWAVHNDASATIVDHGFWDGFLRKYGRQGADGIVRMAYGEVTPADKAALAADLLRLGNTAVSGLNHKEQLAFWIDVYNELTVKLVLDNYPIRSIKDTGSLLSSPWSKKLIKVEGEDITLDDIEHRILRPEWKDPRIHYAVNCASLGCPNLQLAAFTATNTSQLLDAAARQYVNHPRGARVEGGALVVSSIYVWFKRDFGGTDAGVIEHLRHYAGPDLARALTGIEKISRDRYDWSLNDQTTRQPTH